MGKFRGSLYTEFLPPRYWRLTEALKLNTDSLHDIDKQMLNEIPGIKCTKAGMITVPEGYITDLASVPRFCWIFIAPFDVARAAIVHDLLYKTIRQYRWKMKDKEDKELVKKAKIASDKVFLLGMHDAEPKIPGWKSYSSWKAVDLFGNGSIVPNKDNI